MELAWLDPPGPHHSVAVCPLPWPLSRLPPSPFFLPCSSFGPMHIAMLTARGQIIIMLTVARPLTELPGVPHRPSLASRSRSPRPSCINAGAFSGSQAGPPSPSSTRPNTAEAPEAFWPPPHSSPLLGPYHRLTGDRCTCLC